MADKKANPQIFLNHDASGGYIGIGNTNAKGETDGTGGNLTIKSTQTIKQFSQEDTFHVSQKSIINAAQYSIQNNASKIYNQCGETYVTALGSKNTHEMKGHYQRLFSGPCQVLMQGSMGEGLKESGGNISPDSASGIVLSYNASGNDIEAKGDVSNAYNIGIKIDQDGVKILNKDSGSRIEMFQNNITITIGENTITMNNSGPIKITGDVEITGKLDVSQNVSVNGTLTASNCNC